MNNTSLLALPPSFHRIDEKTYLVEYDFENETREAIFEIETPIDDPEFCFCVAKEAKDRFLTEIYTKGKPNLEAQSFRLANKTWKCTKNPKVGKALELASTLTTFVHKHNNDNVLRFKITVADKSKPDLKFRRAIERVKLNQQLQFTSTVPLMRSQVVTPDEFLAGVRAKEGLIQYSGVDYKEFTDPFTILATIAYQKHEKVFHPADFFDPSNCDYCLVADEDELILVRQNEKNYDDPVKNRNAIKAYKDFLIKEYGQEKVDYMQHLYKFDFDSIERLTPDIVFRVNMGLTNLEIQDVNQLLEKLIFLEKRLVDNDHLEITLEEIYRSNQPFEGLTGREIRGLNKMLEAQKGNGERANLLDLKNWLSKVKLNDQSINEMSNDQFNELLSILKNSHEENEAALTGRRIYDYIQGYYTSAGREEYKPQVDQQQLVQMLKTLENSKSDLEYHENLAHVVSKIHLAREHPTEGYRVGALIPATPGRDGQPRWYKVSSCCSNHHGLFSYTLEPACDDPSLPSIKLYRSTASNSYFMHNASSILSDFNAINSPGFEGMGMGDKHEKAFFQERTIPAWVGQLYLAKQGISAIDSQKPIDPSVDLKMVKRLYKDLKNANSDLLSGFQHENRKKNIREIIRSNDAILNDLLLRDESVFGLTASDVDSDYMVLYSDLIKKYIRKEIPENPSSEFLSQMKIDAIKLLQEFDKFPTEKLPIELRRGIKRIKQEVNRGILAPEKQLTHKEKTFLRFYSQFEIYEKEVDDLLTVGQFDQAFQKMNDWSKVLENYAKAIGENIESKKFEDIVFSGHSLGGAAAGAHVIHFTTDAYRIPLPGHVCRAFLFDSPGINEESNRSFLQFGENHKKLFERTGSSFDISHSFEAGDVVHFVGDVHFGATDKEKTALDMRSWCRFYAVINERLPSAKVATLEKALTAHGTRFQEGEHLRTFIITDQQEKADYVKTVIDSPTLGLIDRKGKATSSSVSRKKEYEYLQKHLLKVHPGVRSIIKESMRSSDHPFFTLFKRVLKNGDNIRGEEFVDSDGVFYVSEKGVETSR